MIETLKQLKEKQKELMKNFNLKELNEINKQIFTIRQQIKQQKQKAKEQEQDEKTNQKIWEILGV